MLEIQLHCEKGLTSIKTGLVSAHELPRMSCLIQPNPGNCQTHTGFPPCTVILLLHNDRQECFLHEKWMHRVTALASQSEF